ncbi:MAG: PAS domain S-box protein [Candidatus Omnitrophica bacterium]|nr:PAS domain S-box protein [Candidatus Omnitrophota bacterium]
MSISIQKSAYDIINRANSLIFYCDCAGKILMCNKKFEEIIGLPGNSILGQDCLKVIYHRILSAPGKEKLFKAMLDDAVKYKRPSNFEGVLTDGKSDDHIICWGMSPILTKEGDLEGVLFLGNDITISKEREVSLKNIDETLKNIFLSIKEYALYAINLEGNITYYGMGSEDMFGWQRDEIIFKHISALHAYDDIAYRLSFILEQVKNFGRYELESYFINKAGQSFPVNLIVTRFIDTNGDMAGYIFMAKDITEKRELEYQIFQSEKLAAVGQLVAGIAHEINNPVFVISGRADMMLSNKSLNKKIRADLKIINTQVEQIRKLVDRFLTFTRKTSPIQEELDINKVIKNLLPLLTYHKLPSHEIKVVKLFTEGLPKIKGDIHQLQEVFVNLLINAYQAMPQGGVINIKTSLFSDEYTQIAISDTGCGIPTNVLKNLFMPFFSTKKEGTGLGLSICYNIIKNHNGSISVESQVGKGTTFIIKLPHVNKVVR